VVSKQTKQITSIRAKLDKDGRSAKFTLGDAEVEYIQSRGIDILRLHATDFIQKRIAPAEPKNDGHQTPTKGHPVFIAQHACGCNDRNAVETFFSLKKGKQLSEKEVTLIVDVLISWMNDQLG
jgi:hypothetical protein